MKNNYPYLKDQDALSEIRKHKWIESQKAGTEVGFASAAVDWIKKYGKEWEKSRSRVYPAQDIFLEKRKYRRFKLRGMARLINDGISISAEPVDLSFFGLLLKANKNLPLGSSIKARVSIEFRNKKKDVEYSGRIDRITFKDAGNYDLFLNFDAPCQENIAEGLVS